MIQLGDTAVAAREPGADGGVPGVEAGVGVGLEVATNVVAEAVFEYAESPEALVARTL